MQTERVALRHHAAAGGAVASIALRDLRGRDELAVDGIDTRATLALLDRLIGRDGPRAATLCASDRDSMLAAFHRREWGDHILTTLRCAHCGERFDLSFTLSEMQAHVGTGDATARPAPPTGQQELLAAQSGAHAGVAALASALGIDHADIAHGATALESSAPILDLEISTHCAECLVPQEAHFDLQSFVMQRLLGERESLLAEVHELAAHYGWSLREIVSLPRATRRSLLRALDDSRARAR